MICKFKINYWTTIPHICQILVTIALFCTPKNKIGQNFAFIMQKKDTGLKIVPHHQLGVVILKWRATAGGIFSSLIFQVDYRPSLSPCELPRLSIAYQLHQTSILIIGNIESMTFPCVTQLSDYLSVMQWFWNNRQSYIVFWRHQMIKHLFSND